jgi:hypothetical protein
MEVARNPSSQTAYINAFATFLVVSCNVSSTSVATTLICIAHNKILIDTCNCNYFRKHL